MHDMHKLHDNGPNSKTVNISPSHSECLQAFFDVKTIFLQTSDCAGVFQSKHVARYIEKHSENNLKQINSPILELHAHSGLCHHKSHLVFDLTALKEGGLEERTRKKKKVTLCSNKLTTSCLNMEHRKGLIQCRGALIL